MPSLLCKPITGTALVVAVTTVVAESTLMLTGAASVDGVWYLLTLAAAVVACVAHLFVCLIEEQARQAALYLAQMNRLRADVSQRLDCYEANGLHTLLTADQPRSQRAAPRRADRSATIHHIR